MMNVYHMNYNKVQNENPDFFGGFCVGLTFLISLTVCSKHIALFIFSFAEVS